MKLYLKTFFTLCFASCVFILLLNTNHHCPTLEEPIKTVIVKSGLQNIDCVINGEKSVKCLKVKDDVFVPFTFLHEYFEIYGKVVKDSKGLEKFDWQHSYSKVYYPKGQYDPTSKYLWLEYYYVEGRDRVKCISGAEGVPISTQWNLKGHFYPIQIAQFGLSHFSKNISEPAPSYISMFPIGPGRWTNIQEASQFDEEDGLLHFESFQDDGHPSYVLNKSFPESTLLLDINIISNLTIKITMQGAESKSESDPYYLWYRYGGGSFDFYTKKNNFYYFLGSQLGWRHITRDLIVDIQKGAKPKKKITEIRRYSLKTIEFWGKGAIRNLSLASSAHKEHFFAAADWLLESQDESGGWPIMVSRKLSNGKLELPAGWYSAMAQGQAISLLTRAFLVTQQIEYLQAAVKGLNPFKLPSEQHGVQAVFFDKYVWYEEYPTTPSSFVLNGFIFSLFGLYDLRTICSLEDCQKAGELFEQGLTSLKKMLPLFDTGSGTIYDLRHHSLGIAPNIARWDYHTAHINQLLWISTIDSDPIWETTAKRWISYMKGQRAPHN